MAYERFSYVYDRLMEDMPYEEWLQFARQCWDKYGTPRTVVDLGCGTGSLAIPLAMLGHEVIGIDLSGDMLTIAQQKADTAQREAPFAKGGKLTLLQQDIREWTIGKPADAVVSFCDCLNYLLEPDDLADAFRQTYAGLAPGGIFAFDMHTPYQLQSYWESQPFMLNEDDVAYIWTCDFDSERCEIEHELTVFVKEDEGAKRESAGERFIRVDETHRQRAYPLDQVTLLLKAAGFHDISVYADFLWKKPTEDTQRAFFVAVKK
ncbi:MULTISPECIES: class I SAM-dependent DNA methyltransferase [Paenibacillus]|uniref:class I SAM-dependent DNA methyltransferase n=1 Tax=Paenibacillus TaxID=44249 RepID=UPI001915EF6A|nr:class I SAM-dependent methyltransferase [Paenibacillus sp. EPM92]